MTIGPSFAATTVFAFGRAALYPFDLLLICAVVLFFAFWSVRPLPQLTALGKTVVVAIGAYLGYQLLVVLPYAVLAKGVAPTIAIRLMVPRFMLVLVVFYALVGFRYVSHRTVIGMWTLVGAAIVAYAVYRFARFGPVGYTVTGITRLRVVGGQTIAGIGWLLVVSPIVIGSRRWLSVYVLPALGVVGLLLVNHRGAYVAIVAVVALGVALHVRRAAKPIKLGLTIVALSVTAVAVAYGLPQVRDSAVYSLRTAFNPNADRTARDRVDAAPIALEFFLKHPMGDVIWDDANRAGGYVERGIPAPENFILIIFITEGIAGLVLWGILFSAGFITAWRNSHSDRISEAMLYYMVLFIVFGLTNGVFQSLGALCILATSLALVISRDMAHAPSRNKYCRERARLAGDGSMRCIR